jgi:hypothetical protein
MKKIVVLLVVVAVLALAFTPANSVFANSGNGNGFGGNGAGLAGQTGSTTPINGTLHDYIIAAYAEALNLSVDEIETRLTSGETLSSIALSTGLTIDEFRTLVADARTSALAAAVSDGVITQAQADWMTSHMGGANARRMGTSSQFGGFGGGMRNSAQCPYYQTAQ